MARKPQNVSITSIAAELGVSVAVISRVINNRTNVSEETRRRVLNVLRQHNFKVNYPAQHIPKIAVISGDKFLTSNYVINVKSGIYSYVNSHNLICCDITCSFRQRRPLLSMIRDQQCAGVIILIPAHFKDDFDELNRSGLPTVLVDEPCELTNIGYIDNDSYAGSFQAAEYLITLGHRNIAYIASNLTTGNHQQRFQAYLDAMGKAGFPVSNQWRKICPIFSGENNLTYGRRVIRELFSDAPETTAVMFMNDEIALGAIAGATALGLSLPRDLSVIGFDNYDFCNVSIPALTTVQHRMRLAGYLATKTIHNHLKNNGNTSLQRLVIPTRLLIRSSCTIPRNIVPPER